MNVLFLKANEAIQDELQEFLQDHQGKAFFANMFEEAVTRLHAHPIDIAVLDLKCMADIQLLKYISEYFINTRIVLVVESNVENAISTIRNSQFGILHKPFTLQELGEIVGQE